MRKHIVIIAEKAQAAEKIALALSNRTAKIIINKPTKVFEFHLNNAIYRVVGTDGHLYTTEFAKRVHEKPWHKVNPKYLLTKAPLTKIIRSESRKIVGLLKFILRKVDEVIIATDFDREGENIGAQVVQFIISKIPRKIRVRRAIFSSLVKKELIRAFKPENLVSLNHNMIEASEIRQELDLRYGVAFTRLATMHLHRRFPHYNLSLLSVGPCQTPTLGLIVERYKQHLKSVDEASKKIRYRIVASVEINGFTIELKSRGTFDTLNDAKSLISKISGKDMVITDINEKISIKSRPLPLNTTRLAALAARFINLSPYQALKFAEDLYLKGLISYPRTETEIYSKEVLSRVFAVANKIIETNNFDINLKGPRQGKLTDNAHPPIHPTKVIKLSQLSKKLKKKESLLYELITRHFIANLSDNAKIKIVKIIGKINGVIFEGETRYIIEPGFLNLYTYEEKNSVKDLRINISQLKNAKIKVVRFAINEVKPRIVQPIGYSELVDKMANLGIGTDATFAEHIKKNLDRGYVIEQKGRLIPTPYGLAFAEALKRYSPEVIDPSIRASIEELFSKVENGELKRNEAIRIGINKFVELYDEFSRNIDKIIDIVEEGLRKTNIRKLLRKKKRH